MRPRRWSWSSHRKLVPCGAEAPLTTAQADADERLALGLAANAERTALCLSGGGIRSAAFSLGTIQALAEARLLTQFHYLSSVSGGGYIAGWLLRWIRTPEGRQAIKTQTLPTLKLLRRYTNYLTPEPGPISDDSWQAATIYARNTIINWTLFAPLLLAAAAMPLLHLLLLRLLALPRLVSLCCAALLGLVGLVWLYLALVHACLSLPSHSHPDRDLPADGCAVGETPAQILRLIVARSLAWALLGSLAVAPLYQQPIAARPAWDGLWQTRPFSAGTPECKPAACPQDLPGAPPCGAWRPFGATPLGSGAWRTIEAGLAKALQADRSRLATRFTLPEGPIHLLAMLLLPIGSFLAGFAAYFRAWRKIVHDNHWEIEDNLKRHSLTFRTNRKAWMTSCFCSAVLLAAGLGLGAGRDPTWLVTLGPLWIVVSDVLRSTLYVAFRREGIRSGLDREWLGRLNGSKLRIACGYTAAAGATLFLPRLMLDGATWKAFVGCAVFLAGPAGALLGKSAQTAASAAGVTVGQLRFRPSWIVAIISLLFILGLFMLAGRADAGLALLLAAMFVGMHALPVGLVGATMLVIAVSGGIAMRVGRLVKANRFSMHAVYANRLIRAFLGSARAPEDRHPDRYTQFDPADNIRVADLIPSRGRGYLFPVINVALNVTQSRDTARTERKARSFTITPRHCGSPDLGAEGAYIPTCDYAGGDEQETGPRDKKRGISLGTAMTLSGAAASPNMGYHSSLLTAFVMTLFNVRLGAWLPNPARSPPSRKAMRQSSPTNGLMPMLNELLGRSNDTSDYVYLSDGGHFDNLGLYEMLRRRCDRIVVIDAGADPDYRFDSLGHALLHARIDFGVHAMFDPAITPGGDAVRPAAAWASLHYPRDGDRPAKTGWLLYIKPGLPPDAPIELQSYRARHTDFPNTPTIDQFFTESDFESYRALGHLQMKIVLAESAALDPSQTLAALFGRMHRGPTPPTTSCTPDCEAGQRRWWRRGPWRG